MGFLSLHLFRRETGETGETGAQRLAVPLTTTERDFIVSTAFPQLDRTDNNQTLEKLSDAMWNLCLWEQQRTTTLDTKAAALTGLSSLAAAVIAAGSGPTTPATSVVIARTASIALFIVTVLLSLNAQRVKQFGGFLDADVFSALGAHDKPVGDTPCFSDKDPYRCFLRETSLQRWFIYRLRVEANDAKAQRLQGAQWSAAIAVFSLIGSVVLTLY